MSQFKPFYNDWLDYSPIFDQNEYNKGDTHITKLKVNLSLDFFNKLKFDSDSLKKYRIDAAINCAETLGNKPALCISGGVDSQCMLQAWAEAKIDADVFILVFNDNLNIQDVAHARKICREKNIELHEINFNILSFLTRENFDIGLKYHSQSPHFNVHYKLFDILKSNGYTGVCCGGFTPIKNMDNWGTNFQLNVLNFIRYSDIAEFPCQGSFLSFCPKLTWAISLLTKPINENLMSNTNYIVDNIDEMLNKDRYGSKINGYIKSGFKIIPQEQKFTGFELVKKYFKDLTGDPWEFEKRFRQPLSRALNYPYTYTKFDFDSDYINLLEKIYIEGMSETLFHRSFGKIINTMIISDGSYFHNMRPW